MLTNYNIKCSLNSIFRRDILFIFYILSQHFFEILEKNAHTCYLNQLLEEA